MTQYTVINDAIGYRECFFNLTSAKKAMKENNARGYKTKIYSNGDSIDCGEILLKGSNKTYIANTRMTKANY
jgi:hypothetical protein